MCWYNLHIYSHYIWPFAAKQGGRIGQMHIEPENNKNINKNKQKTFGRFGDARNTSTECKRLIQLSSLGSILKNDNKIIFVYMYV